MQLALRLIAVISFIVAIVWVIQVRALEPEPILAFLTGLTTLALSFSNEKKDGGESLDQHNRRVMLNHVENFWVKGILEKSLHGVALLELGIKEDPTAIHYPWGIKRESTNEMLPTGKSMLEIFNEIGAGRSLLILGAPGSGKTTMLFELARQLIERARNDETEPVPVVFNLASWTEKQTFADWLSDQLNIVYYVPKKTAPKWVSENKMLLLLDGLDEVKEELRAKCVETINQFRNEQGLTSLVVCSRMQEYSAIKAKLFFEGAIALQPLSSKQVNAYFQQFGKSLAGVKQLLKKDEALRELVETPLMLSIMALAYKDMNPEQLPRSKNMEGQRKYLFNTYIDRMLERSNRARISSFTRTQTLNYLRWLARKMIEHNIIIFQVESIKFSWINKKVFQHLYSFTIRLLGVFFIGSVVYIFIGLLVAFKIEDNTALSIGRCSILFGIALVVFDEISVRIITKVKWFSLETRKKINDGLEVKPFFVDKINWSRTKSRAGLRGALIYSVTFCFLSIMFSGSLIDGILIGLLSGVGCLLVLGFSIQKVEETTYPGERLKRSIFNAFLIATVLGLFSGIISWLIFGIKIGLSFGLSIGIAGGIFFGGYIFFGYWLLRAFLVMQKIIPKQLILFLNYYVELVFLRRVGGSYIFVHRLLMEHFAEMEVEKP